MKCKCKDKIFDYFKLENVSEENKSDQEAKLDDFLSKYDIKHLKNMVECSQYIVVHGSVPFILTEEQFKAVYDEIETITIEELYEKINNEDIDTIQEILLDMHDTLSNSKITVVTGQSDDLLEFDGAIYEEMDAYDGLNAYGGLDVPLDKDGIFENRCKEDHCPYYEELSKNKPKIISKYENGLWNIDATFKHVKFSITDDETSFGNGIIFYMDDVEK